MKPNNETLFAITNYILDNGKSITHLKLQKLLFFFYGIHSCIYTQPPFQDTIQAWQLGPVIPTIYYEFRDSGKDAIINRVNISEEEEQLNYPILRDKNLLQSAKITLLYYDRFSAGELVNKSHELNCWKDKYIIGEKVDMVSSEIIKEFDEKIMPSIVEYINSL